MGYSEIREVSEAIGDMESASPTLEPIVLRHKDFCNTDGQQLFGLYGIRVSKASMVGGGSATSITVDENKPCTFYHDRNNIQFAVIPDCEKNRNVLLSPNNVRQLLMTVKGERAPLLTIVKAPDSFMKEFQKLQKEITEKKIDPKPKYEKLLDVNDPFNYQKADMKMPVEGEANFADKA